MAAMGHRLSLIFAFGLGVAAWLGVLAVGPGVTPLDSGPHFFLALGAASFLIALVEGELTAIRLLALYAGQATALCGQALLGPALPNAPAVPLQLLFLRATGSASRRWASAAWGWATPRRR